MTLFSTILNNYSGLPNSQSWTGMNRVLEAIEETVDYVEKSREELREATDKSGKNEFTMSREALDVIGNKYDASNTLNYGIINPVTGSSGYVAEFRQGLKNYESSKSIMNILYLQREAYKTILYSGLQALSEGLNSREIESIISDSRGDIDEVKGYIEDAEEYKEKMNDYTETALDYWYIAKLVLYIIYIVCVVIAILSLVTLILHTKFSTAKYFLQTLWVLLLILIFAAILLVAVFSPVAVFMAESSDLLTFNEIIYNRDIIKQSLWDTISVCLIGDGNLNSVYDLTSGLNFMKEIADGLDIMDEIYSDGKLKYPLNDEYVNFVFFFLMLSSFMCAITNLILPLLFYSLLQIL